MVRLAGRLPVCFALLLGVTAALPLRAQAAVARLGLVIGEARYAAGALPTPANDAGAVAQGLAAAGFEVTGYADLDREGIREALSGFLDKARQAGPEALVFVYLAGHGVQFNGGNFIVPVEARLARDVDVPAEAVPLADFTRDLAALPLKARILVCDLARPNAFAQDGSALAGGLAMAEPPAGTTIAFNAAPGAVAEEVGGDYGLYAQALTETMQTKGLSADALFARLRLRVATLSDGREVPWSDGAAETALTLLPPLTETASLLDPLKALASGRTASAAYWVAVKRDTLAVYRDFLKAYPGDPLAARVGAVVALRREASLWAQARRAHVAPAYWSYMRFYPRGPHFADARRALAALPAALEPPPRFDVYAFPDLPAPRVEEVALLKGEGPGSGPAAMPSAADLPPRRAEFYERLPPLLAVAPGSLPIAVPIPLGGSAEAGRILQPGLAPGEELVIASDVADRNGNLTVVQTGRDGRVLSTAGVTPEPNGARSLVQTGPDGQAAATVVDRTEPNGRRTVTQTGRDKQLISRSVIEALPGGGRTVTLWGAQGIVTTIVADASGISARIPPTPGAAPGVLLRPTVLAMPRPAPRTVAQAPPPPKPTVASTMPLPNLADGAPARAVAPAAPDRAAASAAPEQVPVSSLSGTGSPTIDLPGRTNAQPMGPPAVPVVSAPLNPPKTAAAPIEPSGPSSGAVPPVAPPVPPAAAEREEVEPPASEPLPPRRMAEAVARPAAKPAGKSAAKPAAATGRGKPQAGPARKAKAAKPQKSASAKAGKGTSTAKPATKPAKPKAAAGKRRR